MNKTNILVWGLGYVGTVSSACLSKLGFNITGIDMDRNKIDSFKNRVCPIKEPELDKIIIGSIDNGYFEAIDSVPKNLNDFEFSLICVGTPSKNDGGPDLSYLESVCKDIGQLLSMTKNFHNVIIRSTVFPGTTELQLMKIIEKFSNKKAGLDFGLVMNPEFLREATAVKDFFDPPYTVIGGINQKSINHAKKLYKDIPGKVYEVSLKEAEILKMVNNAFHATKISFANEIGRLCNELSLNSSKIMEVVCADKKLNISDAYLKPGFAFGGSCLPKDLRALNYFADRLELNLPLLNNILESNEEQINYLIRNFDNDKTICYGILGLSFKTGTDDLRESPTIKMIKLMEEKGFKMLIYDNKIILNEIFGANLQYLKKMIPNYQEIIVDDLDIIRERCNSIVITNNETEYYEFTKSLDSSMNVLDFTN